MSWKAGIAKAVITPETSVWLSGYGSKRAPEGKLHDLWVKVLALEDPHGKRVALATTDHMGISKTVCDKMVAMVAERCKLDRADVMFTFSHNHCGPRLKDDLTDYYPYDADQEKLVAEYSDKMAATVVDAVARALADLAPATLTLGEGNTTFAVNRRDNPEADVPRMIKEGIPFKGAVDHSVPVLAVHRKGGRLDAVLFGYACHPTTLSFRKWCGDYPGFAQIDLEKKHPGVTAMFFNQCGADLNPLPRRKVELCEKYGAMLATAVDEVLAKPMRPLPPGPLRTAFAYADLAYQKVMTRADLEKAATSTRAIHARWGKRMLAKLDAGETFAASYPYPVHAWKLADGLLFIGIGGEAVVDYSLRFKKEFGPITTWTCGYADDLVAYIPSLRVWKEGGYEGGPHLDEYGRPALRWANDVEARIATTLHQLITHLNK